MQAKQSSTVLGVERDAVRVQAAGELTEATEATAVAADVWIAAVEWSSRARHRAGRPVRLVKAEAGWIAW